MDLLNTIIDFLQALWKALPGTFGQGMIWGIAAIGVFITYRLLDFADLTVDGSLATGGAVCVVLIKTAGMNPWLALLCAAGAGMLAGLVTGLFHTKCGIPAILSGILTQLMLYSINLRIMKGNSQEAILVKKFPLLVSQRYVRDLTLDNPLPLILLIVAVLACVLYWFFGTERGCALRATGANPNMARAQGINTKVNIVLGLMISNAIVAMAGAFLAQYTGAADVNMGRGAIVTALAAVIIGEVVFGKISGSFLWKLAAVTLGAVIYFIVMQIIILMGLNTNDLKLITALVVAIFLAVPFWQGKLRAKVGRKLGGKKHA